MIRALAVGFAALAAAPAALAEGGAIRSGEHDGFSRIVMEIEPRTEWSLELTGGGASILFPRKEIEFRTDRIFELIPRTRIQSVETSVGPAGTMVNVALGCDCRVSTVFVGGRHLALDVSDRHAVPETLAPEPESEPVAAAEARERAAVSSAEEILIRQIERAADQGLIELASPDGGGAEVGLPVAAEAPAPLPRPNVAPPPTLPVAINRRDVEPPAALAALLEQDQVRAVTVFDRDRSTSPTRAEMPAVQVECRPDDDFAIDRWADSRPAHAQIAARALRLVGEFDASDPVALRDIARIQIRFGLGVEAEQLLGAFAIPLADRPLLIDLARAVEQRPPLPGGPLSVGAACPGAHGLWLAIAGTGPAYRDATHFAGIGAAFGELPPDLRLLVGPGLIGRLIDENEADAARLIFETMSRPEPVRSAALRLAEARLVALEGSSEAAARALGDLVEINAHNTPDALGHLARLAIDTGVVLPDRLAADLAGQARMFEATAQGPEYRALLAEVLAARGEIAAAINETRAGRARWPGDPRFAALAVALLSEATPAITGAGAYAETVLTNRELLPVDPDADAARLQIARHLLDIGLAAPAREFIAPVVGREVAAALIIDAEAALALGETGAAQQILSGLEGDAAALLRARALAREGAFDTALNTLIEAGLDAGAGALAWPSGDWNRAANGEDAARGTMARYMAARSGSAAVPGPAADPDTLTGPEAFTAPLPGLDPPSLAAARRLLDTGRELEDFVGDLLQAQ